MPPRPRKPPTEAAPAPARPVEPGLKASPTPSGYTVRILFSAPLNLGPGKIRLLEAIRETGSISGAGRVLKISYRRAWLMADTLNKAFPGPLIDTVAGGVKGGGARLTPLGEEVLGRYRRLEAQVRAAVSAEAEALLALASE